MRSKNRYSYFAEEIALDEATELPEQFYALLEKWREQAWEVRESDKIDWYSKDVSIVFVYQEKRYRLIAEDFFSDELVDKMNRGQLNSGYYHAIVESIQGTIKSDLLQMGAADVCKYGYLD